MPDVWAVENECWVHKLKWTLDFLAGRSGAADVIVMQLATPALNVVSPTWLRVLANGWYAASLTAPKDRTWLAIWVRVSHRCVS
ncbi:MAG: hypothetical protein MUQ30_12765 [Anaerolineae bacterium]|nr:hypothetical protein [Anaerolineae bacterium]